MFLYFVNFCLSASKYFMKTDIEWLTWLQTDIFDV